MIIKDNLKENFTIVSNEIIRSKDLSINAKMLAVLLCSLPKNWLVNTKHLSNELGLGIRSVQRAFKELVDLNFIKKVQMIDESSNKFTNSYSIVFVGKNENEINKSLENESEILENLECENENEKEPLNTENNEVLESKSPNETALSEFKELEICKNDSLNLATNSRHAEKCRTYIRKEFLQSKNLFLMKNYENSLFFIFEKSRLKKDELNLKDFDEIEKSKIDEWLKYKALKRPLNILSKQRIIKELRGFKAKGQDIAKIIDRSILNGWQGLFFIQEKKKLEQGDILDAVLKQEPGFNFSDEFDLSGVKVQNKSVKYNAKNDLFELV